MRYTGLALWAVGVIMLLWLATAFVAALADHDAALRARVLAESRCTRTGVVPCTSPSR